MNRLGVFEWQLEVWFELGVEQRFDLGMWGVVGNVSDCCEVWASGVNTRPD